MTVTRKVGFLFLQGALLGLIGSGHVAEAEIATEPADHKQIADAPAPAVTASNEFHPERVLVRYKPGTSRVVKEASRRAAKARRIRKEYQSVRDLQLVDVPAGSVTDVLRAYRADPNVLYAEPDYTIELMQVPNDEQFHRLWGMRNTGQPGNGPFCHPTSAAGMDIDATRAWDLWTGDANFRIAVIDTGIDYLHPDLAENVWTNPAEAPGDTNDDGCPGVCGIDDDLDGLTDEDSLGRQPWEAGYTNDRKNDDDENGWIDDIHGFDMFNQDADPQDDHSHGTHVAGTIGAVGNNGIGVAGVNWRCKVVALKVFGRTGTASTLSHAIEAVDYVTINRIRVSNNSWGFSRGYSQSLYDAIAASQTVGHVFVAAAGNDPGRSNDQIPQYPASYNLPNILSVAAMDNHYTRALFSQLGRTTVDLAAPGACVYSTVLNGRYDYKDGTSMATPHVTGVVGLVLSRFPELSWRGAKEKVLYTVRPIAELETQLLFPGVVDAAAAIDCNRNGRPDEQDIAAGASDCTGNGVPDECEPDCNNNGVADSCDIENETSPDCNDNARPDECEPDCNRNGRADSCDVALGTDPNCNANSLPDQCEIDSDSTAPGGPFYCTSRCSADCNDNAVLDICELAAETSEDCTQNGVLDECEPDCNGNGSADSCDIEDEISVDCSFNRIPDECEPDCNGNGQADSCDIYLDFSQDCDENRIPDECDNVPQADCNANGIPDRCDLITASSRDCNSNEVLDECDLRDGTSLDANATQIPDECDGRGFFIVPVGANAPHVIDGNRITLLGGGHRLELEIHLYGWDLDGDGTPRLRAYEIRLEPSSFSGGDYGELNPAKLPCKTDNDCFERSRCLPNGLCDAHGAAYIDRNRPNYVFYDQFAVQAVNPMLTVEQIVYTSALWRQTDVIPDDGTEKYAATLWLDVSPLAAGTFTIGFADRLPAQLLASASQRITVPTLMPALVTILPDCNKNGIPDDVDISESSTDCDLNGIPDECLELEPDCNASGQPDACDIADGFSEDCNSNGVPDECLTLERDCNENTVPDACDIAGGLSKDCNANDVPDECLDREGDCNQNFRPDACDIAVGSSGDCNENGVPDECLTVEEDCNGNGTPDSCDIASKLEHDCNENRIPDRCDIAAETSMDCDADNIPDECVSETDDCNDNSIPDSCDIAGVSNGDCNRNSIPDDCDIRDGVSQDENQDGVPDECRKTLRVPRDAMTIQAAVDQARSGDMIVVADGVYRGEGNTSVFLRGKALTLRSENGPQHCVIDCLKSGRAFSFSERETVLTRLEGFTITGGSIELGGGIRCVRSSPTIANCHIVGNSASVAGGGIYCDLSSHPIISHCIIAQNTSAVDGGGIFCQNMSSPLIRNCLIVRNVAASGGGAVFCDNLSNPTITQCTFSRNLAAFGGAIYGARRSDIATPGFSGPLIHNSILWGDNGTSSGDEIHLARGAHLAVEYSTVLGGMEAAGISARAILRWGDGNLNEDPFFLDAGGLDGNPSTWEDNNYRLFRLSTSINAGSVEPAGDVGLLDLDGHGRVLCGVPDMGAYEFGIGDYDCDGALHLSDLTHWAGCATGPAQAPTANYAAGCEAFDFDFDGAVDLADWAQWQRRLRP